MEGGEAALAPYYAGDALVMIEDNPDLAFCIPAEGTNFFIDAMCIPKGCKQKEAAEMFINFMCETEIALANTEFIGYSSPHAEAAALLPEELKTSPIMYPAPEVMETTEIFEVLPEELAQLMDKQWSDVRSYDESGSSRYMIPIMLVLTVGVIVLILRHRAIKKFRDDY
jgi:spermidine/putrescine transport system substrate-binding protein